MPHPNPTTTKAEELDETEESDTPDPDEVEEPATASPPPAPTPPKNKGGRPRKNPIVPYAREVAGATNVSAPALVAAPMPADAWPTDAIELWPRILRWGEGLEPRGNQPPMLMGPQDFVIQGTVAPSGPYASGTQRMQPIRGVDVAGYDGVSPGEALFNFLADNYQSTMRGPATYKLRFTVATSGQAVKSGEVTLPSYDTIVAQRASIQRQQAERGFGATPRGAAPPWPPPPAYRSPAQPAGYLPPPYAAPYYPTQPPYYPPPPVSTVDPQTQMQVEGLRREIATMLGRLDERTQREAAAQLGIASAPSSPLPPATTPAEDPDARTARVVMQVLQTMGIGPQAHGVGALPMQALPQVSAVPVPQPGIAGIVTTAQESLAGIKSIAKVMQEFEALRVSMGLAPAAAEGPEEPPEPTLPVADPNAPPFGVRRIPFSGGKLSGGKDIIWPEFGEDDNFASKAAKFAASNPEIAMTLMEVATRTIDQGALGTLIKAFTGSAGAVVPAPAQMGVGAVPTAGPPLATTGSGGYPPP